MANNQNNDDNTATLLPERDYVTFGHLLSQIHVVCLSVVCNVRARCIILTQLQFLAMFLSNFVLLPPLTSMPNFTEIVSGKLLRQGLNASGVAKCSDIGTVEGYILETLQDMASCALND